MTRSFEGEPGGFEPSASEEVAQELGHDLMSPYCPGRTIASCPTQAARDLEADILQQAESGRTREQIEAELVERFGPDIVGYRGDPVVLYGSVIMAVSAAFLLAWFGQRWVRRARKADAGPPGAQPEAGATPSQAPTRRELDRLENELDDIEEF